MESKKTAQYFLAVDKALEVNIVRPTENVKTGGNMVSWGDGNIYPDYLLGLYNDVTTLRSIINGNVDFITGDVVTILPLGERFANGVMNKRGDTIREQIKDIAKDYEIYGGYALQIIRKNRHDKCRVVDRKNRCGAVQKLTCCLPWIHHVLEALGRFRASVNLRFQF